MNQPIADDALKPANELVSLEEIDLVIESIISDAHKALEWCVSHGFIQQAAPLQTALDQISGRAVRSSTDIGEAGFQIDDESGNILMSSQAINMIFATARSLSGQPPETPLIDHLLARAIISLYLFHEFIHISQQFTQHSHAQEIKQAFGKDFLAIMDTITDIKAIHCASIMQCALLNKYNVLDYIENLKQFAVLSFRSVTNVFSVKGADHKKRRALGLLSTIAACEVALNCEEQYKSRAIITASSPLYSGYNSITNRIVCVRIDNAEILYITNTSDNEYSAKEIWENIENIPLPSAIIFLKRHLEYTLYRKIA